MNNQFSQNQTQDPTTQIEALLNTLLASLDTQSQTPNSYLPQLNQQPRIIINGQPFGSKQQFQSLWSTLPLTNHQVMSCDAHLIPNSDQYIILAHLKVRFDESGRNKLGETTTVAEGGMPSRPSRPIWSHWFGVSLSIVLNSSFLSNQNSECISTWDYRFTEKPDNSVFQIA